MLVTQDPVDGSLPAGAGAALPHHGLDVPDGGSGDVHPEHLPDDLSHLRIYDDMPVCVGGVPDRQRPERGPAFFRSLPDPADHLLPEVRAVVLRQTLQERLQQDPLRAVRDRLLRVVQLHAGLPELDLIHGDVLAAAAEAVDLPDDHRVKAAPVGVVHHPQELVPALRARPGDVPVRVDPDHLDPMRVSIGPAVRDLPLDGLVRLAGPFAVPRVYYAAGHFTPRARRMVCLTSYDDERNAVISANSSGRSMVDKCTRESSGSCFSRSNHLFFKCMILKAVDFYVRISKQMNDLI